MNDPLISLIIAVYNKSEKLRLILAASERQTFRDFEVVIADDGSCDEVKKVIDDTRLNYHYDVQHIRHEDIGWRKNMILNKAVRAARASYLVFIDGDCIPQHAFLEDHWKHRKDKIVLGGRRAEMSKRWSESLTPESIQSGDFERIGLREWLDGITGKAVAVESGLRFESKFFQTVFHLKNRGLLGSNFSIEKKYLEEINGFDEEYDAPGCGEDSDIQFRLSLIHVKHKLLRHQAIQFHLYHPPTQSSEKSYQRFQQVIDLRRSRCEKGLDQYQSASGESNHTDSVHTFVSTII